MKKFIQTNLLLLCVCFLQTGHTKQKGRFCIAAKTSFFVVSNEKNADIS